MHEDRIVAVDWGSTHLRCWLLDGQGQVLAERGSEAGASRIVGGSAAFDAALQAAAQDWLGPQTRVYACGMVGSVHGWREVLYQRCPLPLSDLGQGLAVLAHSSGAAVHLVPGVICEHEGGAPDVMRGEETQLLGAIAQWPALAADSCIVMPGTHSKWARVQGGRLTGFQTRMTGELYAVLRQHSVLGRLMLDGDAGFQEAAFDAGVARAVAHHGQDLAHHLFTVRTLGVAHRLPPQALPDYLSGLLIGSEIAAGLAGLACPVSLLGEAALCQRYGRALGHFGITPAQQIPNTAAAGLWAVATRSASARPHA